MMDGYKSDRGIFGEILKHTNSPILPDKEFEKWLSECKPIDEFAKFESGYPLACTHSYPDICEECQDKIIEWGKDNKNETS